MKRFSPKWFKTVLHNFYLRRKHSLALSREKKQAKKQFVEKTAKKYSKAKAFILKDFERCAEKYGCTFDDYYNFGFCELTEDEKGTFTTFPLAQRLADKFNKNEELRRLFDEKTRFSERFNSFIGRKWLDTAKMTPEDFAVFSEGTQKMIFKPDFGCKGRGVQSIKPADYSSAQELFDFVKSLGNGVVEEWICQHEELSAFYPDSVNPIRILTVLKNGKVHFFCSYIAVGNALDYANACADALFALVDSETGRVLTDFFDTDGKKYSQHPKTGKSVKGYQIPFWAETLELLEKAARVVPENAYIGWDIAITPTKPTIIEGNGTFPGYTMWQIYGVEGKRTGTKHIFDALLSD